jgi:protein tyrosine phosphatase (PTP) superfamily phosphohydrolase (DUF442 family)
VAQPVIPAQDGVPGGETDLMSTEGIYNYRKITDRIASGGQPTAEQLRAAAAEGFTDVVNLATYNPRCSIDDEEGLVRSLGMRYHHIPVEWEHPTESDFEAFEKVMHQLGEAKALLHCAANYRVTAFYALYAIKYLEWSEERAEAFRASIWQGSDYPVWERFIARLKTALRRPGG